MATRSTIARRTDTGIESIYCHWDGYPKYNGRILTEHYTTDEKIDALMALGNLSILGSELGIQRNFDTAELNGQCLAYGRDRGETQQEAVTHDTVVDWLNSRAASGCEYGYLWNGTAWETVKF